MTRNIHPRTAVAAVAAAGFALTGVAAGPAQAAPPTSVAHARSGAAAATDQVSATTFADRMVRAWGRGDHTATRYYATATVTRTLFGQADPGGIHWRRTGAQGAAGTTYVTYHDDARGGDLIVGVSNAGLHDGNPAHSVRAARFRDEPASLTAMQWADHLVRAWGRGDSWTASYYATSSVLNRLFAHADPGGPSWARVSAEGAAGTTYVTYRDTATGERMTLGVSNVTLAEGGAHAAYRLRFL